MGIYLGVNKVNMSGIKIVGEGTYQEKTVMPTEENIMVRADDGFDALSSVTVLGDVNLSEENIAHNKTIFGKTGTFTKVESGETGATASSILKDNVAWIDGEKVIGTLEIQDLYVVDTMPDNSFGNDGDIVLIRKGSV